MEQNNVMVSVIMLCYNHEPYIRQALDSVLEQVTDFSYEMLVHDDASTDRSAEIIREYTEKYPDRIRPVLQSENQYSKGVPIRKTFLDPLVRGKYVAFCECDDFWCDPNKLQKQVDFLEANPRYSGMAHNCRVVNADGTPAQNYPQIYRPYRSHTFTLERLALGAGFPGQTASIMHRREVRDFPDEQMEKEFFSLRIATGDNRMALQMLLAGDIWCSEEFMSVHRYVTHGGDSWSARNLGKNLSFRRHAASLDTRGYVQKYYRRPYRSHYVLFHTGAACIGKYLRSPTQENKQVCRQLLSEHGGLAGTLIYLLGMSLPALYQHFARKADAARHRLPE